MHRRAASMVVLLGLAQLAEASSSSELLRNKTGENDRYSGIGRLQLSGSCTAFFIKTPGAAGPAYALTAAHCYSLSSQDVFVDRAASSPVTFQFFTDTQDRQVKAAVRRVAYSTMKGTDIALLELDVTQAELVARGVRPLELEATEPARAGDRVEAVGAPGLFFDIEERFLRRSRCQILNERVDLLEFRRNFRSSQASDCEDIVGGISGSPLIAGKSGEVVGIVNTTTHLAWM